MTMCHASLSSRPFQKHLPLLFRAINTESLIRPAPTPFQFNVQADSFLKLYGEERETSCKCPIDRNGRILEWRVERSQNHAVSNNSSRKKYSLTMEWRIAGQIDSSTPPTTPFSLRGRSAIDYRRQPILIGASQNTRAPHEKGQGRGGRKEGKLCDLSRGCFTLCTTTDIGLGIGYPAGVLRR